MTRSLAAGAAAAVAFFAAGAAASPAAAARSHPRRFTLYSKAEQEQYVNNQDDRARGKGNNPFGNYRDTSPAQQKSPNGPFPGDEAIFSFNLYRDAALTRRAGIATFVCQYNFDKNALCDAVFRLASGATVLAEGSFNFHATRFALYVTGGYAGFAGAKGTVEETPSVRHGQRLRFELA